MMSGCGRMLRRPAIADIPATLQIAFNELSAEAAIPDHLSAPTHTPPTAAA